MADAGLDTEFKRGLGLFDATMVVVGSMIGSGIFIVSAEMAQRVGSPGWLLVAWLLTGVLTVAAALSYGELAALMPRAGGQYVYLREAFSPLCGFLYGWTLFLVIQTGTIAAVGVAFAKFAGVLWPVVGENVYLLSPRQIAPGYFLSLSTAQLVGVLLIALLTATNLLGIDYGKWVQNLFTVTKTGALLALIAVGLFVGWNATAAGGNFGDLWTPRPTKGVVGDGLTGLTAATAFGLFVALCVTQTGSLFSSDAWNNITFTAGEVRNPRRNLPLALGAGNGRRHRPLLARQCGLFGRAAVPGNSERAGRPRRHGDAGTDPPERGRVVDGGGDHGVHVRLRQRPDPGRRPRLLRHRARRLVLPQGRRVEPGESTGLGSDLAGRMGGAAGAAAHLGRRDG